MFTIARPARHAGAGKHRPTRSLAAVGLATLAILPMGPPACLAQAQDGWPARPVRLIVGFPPGGSVDAMARALAIPLGKALGQGVVVENRPGAGQALAAEGVARADPDGYTLGLVDSGPLTVSPHLKTLRFDPFKSFTPVGSVAKLPLLLAASHASGIRDLQDVVRIARDKPGALGYASTGPASMHNLAGEYLKGILKLDILHVPYRGAALAAPDTIAGRVPLMFAGLSSAAPFVRDGQLKAVGVTSPKRSAALPAVPTIAEQGVPGYDAQGWVGLYGPAGLPPGIAARAGAALRDALRDAALIQQEVVRGGNELLGGTNDELAALLVADHARWGRIIREQGIRAE